MIQHNSNPPINALRTDRARTVITPSGTIVRGKFPSRKNERMIHHEGLLELEACYLFELSPNVIAYREQPMKIRYVDEDRLRVYTPDFELTLKTGEIVLVEIKHSTILARTEIHHKYRQISAHMRRVNLAYCILTDLSIRLEPRLSALRYAYLKRLLTIALEAAWERGENEMDIGTLEDAFTNIWRDGISKLNPFNREFVYRRLDRAGEPFAGDRVT